MQPSDHVGGQDRLIWLAKIYRAYATDLQRYIFSKVGEPFLNFIGTEHLLWGLASEGSLASFLTPLGVTPERIHGGLVFLYERHAQQNPSAQAQWIQSAGEAASSEGAQPDVFKLLTPRAKEMIVLAGEEAKNQGEKSIRSAHLLLGMLQEGEGIGARLVGSLGVSLLQARAALAPPVASQACSFCGRTGSHVKRIFLNPVPVVRHHLRLSVTGVWNGFTRCLSRPER